MRSMTCRSVVVARVVAATFAAARTARRLRGVKSTGTRIRRNTGLFCPVSADVVEREVLHVLALQAGDLGFPLGVLQVPFVHEHAPDHPEGGDAICGGAVNEDGRTDLL